MDDARLARLEAIFHDYSIRLDQSAKDGRFIANAGTVADLCGHICQLIKEIRRR